MKRFHRYVVPAALVVGLAAPCLLTPALLAPRLAAADEPTGMRKEMITSLKDAGGKIVELAEATPEAKYAYSPGTGVRSTGQVFVHIVAANYMLPMFFAGKKPPVTEDLRKLEETPPAKAKIVTMLKDSFTYAEDCIAGMTDADMMATTKMFDGTDGTKASLMMATLTHAHEHLGQSIAYARSNGIVPPWTARQEAEAKKDAGTKPGEKQK